MTRAHPDAARPAGGASALTPAAFPGQTFTLYATRGRVYASNVRDKLVDLGRLDETAGGGYAYQLDGDEKLAGSGLPTAEDALAHLATSITFFYLDGQFTALADLGGAARPDLQTATQIQVTLDRRGHAAPAIEADV
ncbi:MAG: hypothetical protein EOO33_01305 [Comamonadaceae bacterium]|nr:MAG: hypothetical protein EOO33_01305 [Comamonadaceae bacterium]